jgi:hypothetical protein
LPERFIKILKETILYKDSLETYYFFGGRANESALIDMMENTVQKN